MKFHHRLPILFFLSYFLSPARAQHLPGVAMENYAGTQALYHNPAFVADSRYKVHVNLVGVSLYEANNHIRYNAPYSFLSLMTNNVPDQYRNEKGAIVLPRENLVEKRNARDRHLNIGIEGRLPSAMFSLRDGQFGVGLSTRVRTITNLTQTSIPIASTLRARGKDPGMLEKLYENQAATLHLNAVGELAFTAGGVLIDNDTDFFKVGATVKRLIGLYNAHILIDDGSYTIRTDPNYNNEKEYYDLAAVSARYGYTADGAYQNFKPTPGWILGPESAGGGWGFDVGMVYEYRPDANKYAYREKGERKLDGSKNKYLYRFSVALTDVGAVRFKNADYTRQYQVTTTNKSLRFDEFQELEGTAGFFGAINTSLATDTTARTTSFRSVLPTALQASLDYQLKPNLYVNALLVQNLISPGAFGMKGESVLAVTPRYETKWYQVSVPVSLMNRYGSLGIGLAGRVGPLWFGTDHLAGLLNLGKPKIFSLYAGISAGLYRRPPKSPNDCPPGDDSFFQRIFRRK